MNKSKSLMQQHDVNKRLFIMAFLVLAALMLPELALAEKDTGKVAAGAWVTGLQNVINLLSGPIVKALAVIAVIVAGIMALFGRLQWMWVVNLSIGLMLIFGAAEFVTLVSGGDSTAGAGSFNISN